MKKTGKSLQKLGLNWRHWIPQRSGLLDVFIVIGWAQTNESIWVSSKKVGF